jgi:hypothetical protein
MDVCRFVLQLEILSMELYILKEDIHVFYVTVKSFPAGIQDAFVELSKRLPDGERRAYYGISNLAPDGSIIYRAAVKTAFEGEGEKYGCESLVITKGNYLARTIMDWHQNIPLIGQTFMEMMAAERMDKNFPCVEWYISDKELKCMAKTK